MICIIKYEKNNEKNNVENNELKIYLKNGDILIPLMLLFEFFKYYFEKRFNHFFFILIHTDKVNTDCKY